MSRSLPSLDDFVRGIHAGDRMLIGRALTLVESKKPEHRSLAQALLARLSESSTPSALRVGITGVPGVGKSTFIDAFGTHLTQVHGKRVAVLAVDPSSERTGGSILGDKTRMQRLARDPLAFVRPSPSGGTLGGVAARTREAMAIFEAAGYEVLLVETVGVGQSETAVRKLTDTFVLLALAGAGDELQGIKRGIMELADLIFVTKSDGANLRPAQQAAVGLRSALRLLHTREPGQWYPQVLLTSAMGSGLNLEEAWQAILTHRSHLEESGELMTRRSTQARDWLWQLVREGLEAQLRAQSPDLAELEQRVQEHEAKVSEVAALLLARMAPPSKPSR